MKQTTHRTFNLYWMICSVLGLLLLLQTNELAAQARKAGAAKAKSTAATHRNNGGERKANVNAGNKVRNTNIDKSKRNVNVNVNNNVRVNNSRHTTVRRNVHRPYTRPPYILEAADIIVIILISIIPIVRLYGPRYGIHGDFLLLHLQQQPSLLA